MPEGEHKHMKKTVKTTLAAVILASGLVTPLTALTSTASAETVKVSTVAKATTKAEKAVAVKQLNSQTVKGVKVHEAGTKKFKATIGAPFSFDNDEGTFKKNGKNYTGKYNGIMFKGGREASGVIQGKYYWDGILVHKDTFLGLYIENGKVFTGVHKGLYYAKGELSAGIADGVAYTTYGKLTGYSSLSGEKVYYKDGTAFTGYAHDLDLGFIDGKPATGETGYQLATNSSKIKNVYYVNGKAIEGKHDLDGSGIEREYQGGIVKDGKYETGSFHEDGSPLLAKYEEGVFIKVLNWFGE